MPNIAEVAPKFSPWIRLCDILILDNQITFSDANVPDALSSTMCCYDKVTLPEQGEGVSRWAAGSQI